MPIYRGSGGSGNSNTSANANQVAVDAAAAAQSATDSANSATASSGSATDSANSATASANSATASAGSATDSSNSAVASANSATASANSATDSANSATDSANSATDSSGSATDSANSATASAGSAANSANSATASASSATASANSATASSSSATDSSNSATDSANSATASANSATASSSSATDSANSATASATSATASAASAAAAQASQEAIDGLYLGAQASDPTLDLNGDPVTTGDWYFNTTIALSKIYTGSSWEVLTATGSVTSVTGTGTVSGLTLTGTVTTSGDLTLGGTLSGITASQLASQNISQWTNDSGYLTSYTEADTLDSVTGRGATTTNAVTVGSLTSTGSVISDAVRTDGTSYSSNVDSAYLIAGTSGWTGATTNWDTYGFQHKIKTDGSGVVRLTIDTHLGEKFSMKNNGDTIFSDTLSVGSVVLGNTYQAGSLGYSDSNWGMLFRSPNVPATYYYGFKANDGSNLLTIDPSGNAVFSSTVTASGGNSTNWNTAYGWGNHASAGYYSPSNPQTNITGTAAKVEYKDGRTDTASYPVLWGADSSGYTFAYSCADVTIQSSTGTLTANTFVGALNGNATTATTAGTCTGNAATATTASKVSVSTAGSAWYDILGHSGGTPYADTACHIHGSGYIQASYFNNTHGVSTRNSDTQFYTGTTDGYIRANSASGLRTSASLYSKAESDGKYLRNDANTNVSAHIEMQDNYEMRFGSGADVRMDFNGTDFLCRSYSHGSRLLFQGENSSGSNRALVYMDPDDATTLYHAGAVKGYTYGSGWRVTGNVLATSNVYAYYSDERLKDVVGAIEKPLESVKAIDTFYYTHNDKARELGYEGSERQVGVSAQSVQAVMPEVIGRAPIDDDGEGGSVTGEDYMTVQYERLVPLLIESIKTLTDQVESLGKKVKELEG